MTLPGAHAFESLQVPNSDLAAVTSRKEKLIVGAENQGGDLFGVTFKGGFNGCVSGINNFDGIAARTYDEGAVG